MIQLSPHFTSDEFACRCGCGFGTRPGDVSEVLLGELELVRDEVGVPLVITSGCRCNAHNEEVGGATNSTHKLGEAADLAAGWRIRRKLVAAGIRLEIPGIGVARTFVHYDVHRGSARVRRPALWTY